jgi:DNA-binding NtrC family response regulator
MAEITLISENLDLGIIISNILKPLNHTVRLANGAGNALQSIWETPVDVVIVDVQSLLPDTAVIVSRICEAKPSAKIILMIYLHEKNNLSTDIRKQIDAWITKPFKVEELIKAIETAIKTPKHQPALI